MCMQATCVTWDVGGPWAALLFESAKADCQSEGGWGGAEGPRALRNTQAGQMLRSLLVLGCLGLSMVRRHTLLHGRMILSLVHGLGAVLGSPTAPASQHGSATASLPSLLTAPRPFHLILHTSTCIPSFCRPLLPPQLRRQQPSRQNCRRWLLRRRSQSSPRASLISWCGALTAHTIPLCCSMHGTPSTSALCAGEF